MPGFREHGIGRRMQHRRAARNPALLANQVGAWQLTEQPVPAGLTPIQDHLTVTVTSRWVVSTRSLARARRT